MTYKRITAFMLAGFMSVLMPLTALAENYAGGGGNEIHYNPGGSGSSTATQGVTKGWGLKVTLTSANPFFENGVSDLPTSPTQQDLDDQFQTAWETASKRYIEPGGYGLQYFTGTPPVYGTISSTNHVYRRLNGCKMVMNPAAPTDQFLNQLAWNCYDSDPSWTDRPQLVSEYAYYPDLADMVFGDTAVSMSGDPGAWLQAVKLRYYEITGQKERDAPTVARLRKVFVANGQQINDNLAEFTWTSVAEGSKWGDAGLKAKWSKLGYVTALMQLCWVAQEIGDVDAYNEMAPKLAAWAQTNYQDSSLMPIIMVEATNTVTIDGSPDSGEWVAMTLPFLAQLAYGNAMAEQLFAV